MKLFHDLLEAHGYKTLQTKDGQLGLDLAREFRPDLILLDLNMPRKDGREALREIKADPELRKIPVVILTTSKAEEDVSASYRDGANSFITKPVSFASLIDVVQALGKYWLQIVDLPTEPDRGHA